MRGKAYRFVSDQADRVVESVHHISDRRMLRRIARMEDCLTTSNCGWSSYRIRELVSEAARDRLFALDKRRSRRGSQ